MKYEDIEKAQNLKNIMSRLQIKYAALHKLEDDYNIVDHGGVEGVADIGYSFSIAKHSDGSGASIDFAGCYIGSEAVKALKVILAEKYDVCKNALEEMGIDIKNITEL